MSGSEDEMPDRPDEQIPMRDDGSAPTADDGDESQEGRPSGPISGRVRSARESAANRRRSRQTKKLKRNQKNQRRKERISEFLSPLTDEVQAARDELEPLRDEFDSDDDKSEQKEEAGGGFLAALLGAPSQRGDFDNDGDQDLGVFFGTDGSEEGDGPDPFGAFEDAEPPDSAQSGGQPGSAFDNVDNQVFDPVADFEQRFEPASDPFDEDGEGR